MIRHLYSIILIIISPIILLRLYIRGFGLPAYRLRIKERFGKYCFPVNFDRKKTTILIHAVSVGEVVAAEPLIKELIARHPEYQIFITTMTPTGSARVQALFSNEIFHCYLPYDFPLVMYKFIKKMNPSLLIIMETELWPNLINACKKLNIRLVLANARLSKKSAEGYARVYRLTKDMLRKIDVIAAQSEADAKRIISLGAEPSDTFIVGNLKFNVGHNFQEDLGCPLFSQIENSGRNVIIAASTRKGEERKILDAIKIVQKVIPSVLLIIVPRHPERFDSVYDLVKREGFTCLRRSTGKIFSEETQVVVGDSMGELNTYYSISHIAFVGGSLVDAGCQNILEPAALSLPIVVGPSQYNFASICENLKVKGGLITVRDEKELAVESLKLIQDKSLRSTMGAIALAEFNANQEALPKLLEIIERQLN